MVKLKIVDQIAVHSRYFDFKAGTQISLDCMVVFLELSKLALKVLVSCYS